MVKYPDMRPRKDKTHRRTVGQDSQDFWHMEPPKSLSKEQQSALRDAANHALEFLDDGKPSTSQKVMDDIKMSDSFGIQAAVSIVKVREELGIPAPEDK